MRAAIYARVSTADQKCAQQLTELRTYLEARGWTLQGEYVDKMTGTKDSRPAMKRLIEAAKRREVDCILVWKMDRWGRSMPHLVASLEELSGLGVRFIAVTQGIDTDQSSPTSKLLMNLLSAFADFERELIVERTMAGLQRARREGRVGGRPRAVVDRDRVAQMHQDGATTREIGARLKISAATVSRILKAKA